MPEVIVTVNGRSIQEWFLQEASLEVERIRIYKYRSPSRPKCWTIRCGRSSRCRFLSREEIDRIYH